MATPSEQLVVMPAQETFYRHDKLDTDSSDRESPERSSEPDEKHVGANEAGTNSELTDDSIEEGGNKAQRRKMFARKVKPFIPVFIWMVATGWWIAALILHRSDASPKSGWLIPTLLWIAITIRVVTLHVKASYALIPVAFVWNNSVVRIVNMIPEKLRTPLGAAGAVCVIIIGTFTSPTSPGNTRGNRALSLFGLALFIALFWLTSHDRKRINWHPVIVGMLGQFILALFVLRSKVGYEIFNFIASLATDLLGYARVGTEFLTLASAEDFNRFVIGVVPPVIFFIAVVQLLYYWGVLQWAIVKFAHIFFWGMHVSGAEAVVAAASPFVGQGESAMLIKPFIPHLTTAEIHQIMTSGFATIAGSVLAAYISMGISPIALVSSCVMSIPASLAISKLRYPESEETLTGAKIVVPESEDEKPANSLHAFANGSWLGIKIAGAIISSLLCILSLIGLLNGILTWWGHYLNINNPELTIDMLLGYLFYPVAVLLGVERTGDDLLLVARLIGTKIVANEFVAFANLSGPNYAGISERSRLIATYAVCGFGNISSVGIQIAILTQLAPSQGKRVAKVALSALLSGVVSTLTSASIAGMLVTDTAKYTVVT